MGQHTNGTPSPRPTIGTPTIGTPTNGTPTNGTRSTSVTRPTNVTRPIAYVLTAVAATAIALWGSFGHGGVGAFHFTPSLGMPVAAPAAAAVEAPPLQPTVIRTSEAQTAAPSGTHAPSRTHAAAPSPYTVSYGFDGGSDRLSQGLRGAPALQAQSANGGVLRTVKHHAGDGIGFPARCSDPGAATCARTILETTGDVSGLNPGTHAVSFGATIKMRPDQTSDGENVVQKGFADGGSEYKLQVDGTAGMPSCAVVGNTSSTIYLAKSSVAIDDGAWHTVACELHGKVLSISVDGTLRGKHAVPAGLSVSNSDELRIGGKGTSPNNDQFNGELDDVWVTVGR